MVPVVEKSILGFALPFVPSVTTPSASMVKLWLQAGKPGFFDALGQFCAEELGTKAHCAWKDGPVATPLGHAPSPDSPDIQPSPQLLFSISFERNDTLTQVYDSPNDIAVSMYKGILPSDLALNSPRLCVSVKTEGATPLDPVTLVMLENFVVFHFNIELLWLRQSIIRLMKSEDLAAFLIGRKRQILSVNQAAKALLERSGPFASHDRILTFTQPEAVELFELAIEKCIDTGTVIQQDLKLADNSARTLTNRVSVQLLPVALSFGSPGPVFLVQVSEETPFSSRRLRELRDLGLTAVEADLAAAVANGMSPKAYASQRGVAYETIRSQLKIAMAKLGVHRQAELAALFFNSH